MKLQNLSTRTFVRLIVEGASLTTILLLFLLYVFTKDIRVILGGFSVMILLFFWGVIFLHYFQKKLSVFTDGLCRTLDEMMDSTVRPQINYEAETLLARISHRLERLYHVMQEPRHKVEEEKAELQSLVSDISHQTKTPMANIKLYSELLSEQLEEDGMEAELLGQIQAQAQKLEFLIQALTKLSRLETNILEVVPVKSQVKPLLESAVEEIRKKAEKKEIQIKIEMDFEAEAVFDRKWTEEALYNLLDNAVKYSPAGSEVLISTKLYEMWCVIAVSDRGRGISEEEIPKIFGRFYRAKEVQQEEGVGIGLYLVREILQKEGGFIKVNSEVGKGSTFLCYLPR